MVGGEQNQANVGNGAEEQPTSETTSISITPTWDEPSIAPKLAPEERASVDALPPNSALLIAHSGPNAGARFLLDADTTTAGFYTLTRTFSLTMSRCPASTCSSSALRRDSSSWTWAASTVRMSTTTALTACSSRAATRSRSVSSG